MSEPTRARPLLVVSGGGGLLLVALGVLLFGAGYAAGLGGWPAWTGPGMRTDYQDTLDRARLASLRTDLRNLMTAQEAFFADSGHYAGSVDQLAQTTRFVLSSGNTAALARTTDRTGYTATAHNPTITSGARSCRVTIGGTPPPADETLITCNQTTPE